MEKESLSELKNKSKERKQDKLKSYFKRCGKDTPPFFKKLRLAGLIIAAVGTTVLTAPIALPAIAVSVAGYLATAGAIASAVSQAAINDGADCEEEEEK
jgi:hypothetical protein